MAKLSGLTMRQQRVITLIAEGRRSKEIARVLSVSPSTIEGLRQRASKKIHARGVADLTRYAMHQGWVE